MLAILCLIPLGLAPVLAAPDPRQDPVDSPALLVRGEKVYVRPGRVIEGGAVLIENGVVVAVGRDLQAPEGARVVSGKVVCPGFIDAWSSMAVESNAARDDRAGAATRATDAVDGFDDPRFEVQVMRAGVTAYRVQPTFGARTAGIGAVIRLDPTRRSDQTVVLADCCVANSVGLSRDGRPRDVFDRVSEVDKFVGMIADGLTYLQDQNEYRHDLEEWNKTIAEKQKELDDGFKKAKKDREKAQTEAKDKGSEFKEKAYKEDKPPKKPRYDEDKEVLARVASGELPVVVEAHRALEIRNLLDGTERFGRLRLILAGGTEAMACVEKLAERRIPVIVAPQPLGTARAPEFQNAHLRLAAELEEAGVEVILASGGEPGIGSRELPLLAALAIGHGFPPEKALAAVTTRAARAFDVGDKIGSLEMGRDGDVLVLDGEPFAAATKVQFVISRGDLVVEER